MATKPIMSEFDAIFRHYTVLFITVGLLI